MNTFLVIVLIGLMAMVVYSLVRGIIAFLQTTRRDIDSGGEKNLRELQLQQNKMMFARVKYQALAVVVIILILAMSR
ncbi:HIG1 domain-containing protein [Altererythrobacter sp. CC-YST694]|uniref:HIG1 domain-containing protein n=1 Tax=Altererythrobacter sp. CC-YST694 TaxID=2755038 RepID=UPI001D02D55E|nr:HIG1 domain-containing protein [Altererythrobacter sp. CC-YST694]MCB5425621.1 HIG1 domain-containing protein [Altererythrobacter sp. CC-YST694]